MHMRTYAEQTQEHIWRRRQDKQAGGQGYSWSPQGPEDPNQFLQFRENDEKADAQKKMDETELQQTHRSIVLIASRRKYVK